MSARRIIVGYDLRGELIEPCDKRVLLRYAPGQTMASSCKFYLPMGSIIASLFPVCVALVACASLPQATYKLYPGPARAPAEIAVVRLGDANAAEFDGRVALRRDWSEVQLLAGTHAVKWQTEFGVSAMLEPSGFVTGDAAYEVELLAGHTYTLKADRMKGSTRQMFFWLRDETTGAVVAGSPKP
jgi:hypothetical protein